MQRTVSATEYEVEVRRRISKSGTCVIEPFTKTIQIEEAIPPLSQKRFIFSSKTLGLTMKCKGGALNEVPYKATLSKLRYQLEGDTIWHIAIGG